MEQSEYTGFEIAIIGMSGYFPDNTDINNLWDKLAKGEEMISFFTEEELLKAGIEEDVVKDPNYIKANSYLKNREYFDSVFFEYSPDEVLQMDPQVRLFHQCVYEALENSGYEPHSYKEKIGLFAGTGNNLNWQTFAVMSNNGGVDSLTARTLYNSLFMPTRLSYKFNLKGPSLSIYSACSTSLVAICNACNNLLLGECKIALAGGIKISEFSIRGYTYEEGNINSPDGHCRAFSANSKGTVPAEGAGVLVLKRLKDAIADNDNILAIIKGHALNNDGNSKLGYVSTSVSGQAEVVLMAQQMAEVDARSISYVEAHGTGTEVGDPIEVEALTQAFGKTKEKYCALGSIKTNVGHMDTAAGVGGVIKVILALQNRQIPPSLHFDKPNPKIDFENSPFYVNTTLKEWENSKYPLRAGVSSFGIGGTNAHIILEEAPKIKSSIKGRTYKIIQISGKTEAALKRNIENLKLFILKNNQINFSDVAYTLQIGRRPYPYRSMFVCKDFDDFKKKIEFNDALKQNLVGKNENKITFMFSGQGAQYVNMCKDLYDEEEEFKNIIDNCLEQAEGITGRDFKTILFNDDTSEEATKTINETINTQPLLFIVEYAISKLLISWGVKPDFLIGHSIGEYTAACISEVFSFNDALKLVIKRGELMQRVRKGSMLSVSIPEDELKSILKDFIGISIAAVNSDSFCVASGEDDLISRLKQFLDSNNYPCQLLQTSHAFHSSMMDEILDEFCLEVSKVKINEPIIPFFSNVTGNKIEYKEIKDPSYWSKHLRNTVLFSKGIKEILKNNKDVIFVEVGPGRALSTFTRSNQFKNIGHKIFNLVRHPKEEVNDNEYLMNKLGEFWLSGIELDKDQFYKNEKRKRIPLPTYSFEKIPYLADIDAYKMIMQSGNSQTGSGSIESRIGEQIAILNANRKEYKAERPGVSSKFEAPNSPQEIKMGELWQKFFGISNIGMNDDFFELGGDSIKATTLLNRIYKEFGKEVSLKYFFIKPTIRGLVDCLNTHEKTKFTEIQSVEKREYYPLAPAQKRLYFLHEFDPTALGYNIPQVLKIEGRLNKNKLQITFNRLIERHESLRTSFVVVKNEPAQKISEAINYDIEYYHADDIEEQIKQFIRPFDLKKAPLFRMGMIEVNSQEYILMVDVHHLVCDGISLDMLINSFITLYNDYDQELLHYHYKDYTMWLDSDIKRKSILKQKDWWLNEINQDIPKLKLVNGNYNNSQTIQKGHSLIFEIGEKETKELNSLARLEGVTLFMLLLSVYNVLLSKLSQQEDIIVGSPVSGRVHVELENIIGMFVNTLALRNYPKGEFTFRKFLSNVKGKVLQVFDNQEYPYDELISELHSRKVLSRNSLFDVNFDIRNQESDENIQIQDFKVIPYKYMEGVSLYDMALNVRVSAEKLTLQFDYRTNIFDSDTVEKIFKYFMNIINAIIFNPDIKIQDIEILDEISKNNTISKNKKADECKINSTRKIDVDFDF